MAARFRKRIKPKLLDSSLFLLLVAMVLFSKEASLGAALGLKRCAETLVPSLFPFMALCIFSIQSGFAQRAGRLLAPVTRGLFYLPPCAGTTILVGLVGGYPVGARSIAALLESKQINQEQAQRMLCFCVGAGPAFIISAVGTAMLRSLTAGVLLFCAQAGCSLLMGVGLGLYARWKGRPLEAPAGEPAKKIPAIAETLVRSTEQAASSTLMMCAFVVLFSTLLGLLSQLGLFAWLEQAARWAGFSPLMARAGLQLFFEVTAGVSASAALGGLSPFFIALSLGWAGLSVHFQIYASLPQMRLRHGAFMLARLFHGLLAGGVSLLLFGWKADEIADVFGPVAPSLEGHFYSSLPFGVSLLFMCGLFLLCLPKKEVENGPKAC